jgi:purine-binding chemotaxis protein CheW
MSLPRQFCTFYVADMFLGIPVERVQEVLRYHTITRVPLAASSVSGLINLRGQIVTAIDLRRRLGLPPGEAGRTPMNVVIRTDDGAVSLLVDAIGDVKDVHDDSFEPSPSTLRHALRKLIRGAHKLDERLLLVLDDAEVLDVADNSTSLLAS